MKQYNIKIVYKGQGYQTIVVSAQNENEASNRAFEYADFTLSLVEESDKAQVELFFLDNPRHQVLFQDVK